MYRKDSNQWIKHIDFIILDLICLQIAFVLAYAVSGYGFNPYKTMIYRNMAVFIGGTDLVLMIFMGTLKNVLKRGYYKNFVVTLQHGVVLGGISVGLYPDVCHLYPAHLCGEGIVEKKP